jgi:acetolactate synthase I/II/III large subunit
MKLTGGQIVVKALEAEGVTFSFGIPGTHNIELYDALIDSKGITTVLVTDEQSASFMADGVARSSGSLAVVNLVPSAGLTNAMSGIAEAYLDQVPLLVLSCGIRRDMDLAYQLHEVDQVGMVKPVSKKTFVAESHEDLYPMIREACQIAKQAPCGPVMVEVPVNLYLFPSTLNEDQLQPPRVNVANPALDDAKIEAIAQSLSKAQSIGIYAGAGALEAREELLELAEKLDAIIYTTISGKGLIPEDNPRWGWMTMGAAAPKQLQKIEQGFDCLLAVGCRFGEVATASYGFHPPDNLIHIDIDPTVFNKNFPARFNLTADAKEAIKTLLSSTHLTSHEVNPTRLNQLAKAHLTIRQEQLAVPDNQDAVTPAKLITTLQEIFGPETAYVTDSGNGTFMAMELLRLTKSRSFMGPIDYSCMGYSAPAAIGAKMANPHRPVVGLIGDGAFLMTGLELMTAATYGVGVVACILHDGELSQISQFQRRVMVRDGWTKVHDYQVAPLAKGIGMECVTISNDGEITTGLKKAHEISQKGHPVLVDVKIDYSTPTYFTKGVVKTNFLRLPWKDRFRMVGRVLKRKVLD